MHRQAPDVPVLVGVPVYVVAAVVVVGGVGSWGIVARVGRNARPSAWCGLGVLNKRRVCVAGAQPLAVVTFVRTCSRHRRAVSANVRSATRGRGVRLTEAGLFSADPRLGLYV